MSRGTKDAVIQRFQALVDKAQKLTDRLFKLVEERKVKSGALFVHAWYASYHYKWLYGDDTKSSRLYGWKREQTKLQEYGYHYAEYAKEVDLLEDLVTFIEGGGDYDEWLQKTYRNVKDKNSVSNPV